MLVTDVELTSMFHNLTSIFILLEWLHDVFDFRQGGRKYEKALEWRLPVVNLHFLNDLLLGDLRALKLPLQAKYQQFSANADGFVVEPWKVAHLLGGCSALNEDAALKS